MPATLLQWLVSWKADPEILSRSLRPWGVTENIAMLAFSATVNTDFLDDFKLFQMDNFI